MTNRKTLTQLISAAMCLALSQLLPLVTAGIPAVGNMLCPMHLPILLCGFLCGPWYGLGLGAVAPLLRFFIFGAPPLYPVGIAMCFELAAYGFFAGFLYRRLPRRIPFLYVSLLSAMLLGRAVWGVARTLIFGLGGSEFGWTAFLAGAFTTAIPGILLQILLVPVIVLALKKAKLAE